MKYLLLVGVLVLAGASCQLQQPEPVEPHVEESSSSQALKAENERLKKENQKLKEQTEDTQSQKEEKDTSEEQESETKEETLSELDTENLNDRGREVLGDIPATDNLADNRITLFAVSEELGTGSESPTFKFGCNNYLYPLTVELDSAKSQSDLATAIVQLLTYKSSETEGDNVVRGKGFILANVTYEDGKRIIELEGEELTSTGICEDARVKAQLEETIALYSDNFEIRLNGSATEWENLYKEAS